MSEKEPFYLKVSGGLDNQICHQTKLIVDQMAKQNRDIYLLINSTGGLTRDSIMLSYFLSELDDGVTTYGDGRIESAALTVFVGGEKRIVHPNCFIHVHPGSMAMNGSFTEAQLLRTAEVLKRDRQEMDNVFAARTSMSRKMRNQVFVHQGRDLDPREAIKLGIAHETGIVKVPADAEQYALRGEKD